MEMAERLDLRVSRVAKVQVAHQVNLVALAKMATTERQVSAAIPAIQAAQVRVLEH